MEGKDMNADTLTTIFGCLSAAGFAAAPLLEKAGYTEPALVCMLVGAVSMAVWGKLTNLVPK
jgi:hypothetical protein